MLDVKRIFLMTFALNALIFVVNLVTGGDYGFLTKPPLVGDHGLVAKLFNRFSGLVSGDYVDKENLGTIFRTRNRKNDCKESLEMSFLFWQ